MIDKIPPQDIEIEKAVLGACMLESGATGRIINDIEAEDFYHPAHIEIFKAIQAQYNLAKPIDILTITQSLRTDNKIDLIGGIAYVSILTNNVSSTANIEYHASLIKQLSMTRKIIKTLTDGLEKAYEPNIDPFSFSKDLAYKIESTSSKIGHDLKPIYKTGIETYNKVIAASESSNELLGLPSSLKSVNRQTSGYSAPDFIIIAGGTGEGKSTLALNEAYHVAKHGHAVAFFSLEMKDYQVIWKILSSEISEDVNSIRRGDLVDYKKKMMYEIVQSFENIPFFTYDVGGLDINQLCSLVREAKRKKNIEMVVIDYLQLLTSNDKKHNNRESEVNFISKRLKALAMELNIPVIALSQLSRLEKGSKRMYRLSDLRESGAIEQDADSVIFVYRPTYHDVSEMDGTVFNENDCIISIAKMRLGEVGDIQVGFNGKHSKFIDYGEY